MGTLAENLQPKLQEIKNKEDDVTSSENKQTNFCKRVTSVLSYPDFDNCEPELVISMLKTPSASVIHSLNSKLKIADKVWIEEFLMLDGFDVLCDVVLSLSKPIRHIDETIPLLQAMQCIRIVTNHQAGLDYFLAHLDNAKKLIQAIKSENLAVKKQVFELLSVISAFSPAGYQMTLDSLESYKKSEDQKQRFTILMNELRRDDCPSDYHATVLILINCLIFAKSTLYDRVNIRKEFISLGLLYTLDSLYEEQNEILLNHYNLFYGEMKKDDEEMTSLKAENIDHHDHKQLFDYILQQVSESAESVKLLSVLQSLMHLCGLPNKVELWQQLEAYINLAVGKVPSLSDASSQVNVQRIFPDQPNITSNDPPEPIYESIDLAVGIDTSLSDTTSQVNVNDSPEPIYATIESIKRRKDRNKDESKGTCGGGVKDKLVFNFDIPHDQLSTKELLNHDDREDEVVCNSTEQVSNVKAIRTPAAEQRKLSISTPTPKSIMKPLDWTKVSHDAVKKKCVVWNDVLELPEPANMEYKVMEQLFSVPRYDAAPKQVSIISAEHKAVILSILKDFKGPNESIIQSILDGNALKLTKRGLQNLLNFLPKGKELEQLTVYNGPINKLYYPEQFLKQFIQIPEYATRLQLMLFKLYSVEMYQAARDPLYRLMQSCTSIISNRSMKQFLRVVLQIGNFINAGRSDGNAIGFKISFLSKLNKMTANPSKYESTGLGHRIKLNLLHYIVGRAEKIGNKESMVFVNELGPILEKSKGLSLSEIKVIKEEFIQEYRTLRGNFSATSKDVKTQARELFTIAKEYIEHIEYLEKKTKKVAVELCDHYGEDINSYSMEDCLEIHRKLCYSINICKRELARDRSMRRLGSENEKMTKKLSKMLLKHTDCEEDKGSMDKLVNQIKCGRLYRRAKRCAENPNFNNIIETVVFWS